MDGFGGYDQDDDDDDDDDTNDNGNDVNEFEKTIAGGINKYQPI